MPHFVTASSLADGANPLAGPQSAAPPGQRQFCWARLTRKLLNALDPATSPTATSTALQSFGTLWQRRCYSSGGTSGATLPTLVSATPTSTAAAPASRAAVNFSPRKTMAVSIATIGTRFE